MAQVVPSSNCNSKGGEALAGRWRLASPKADAYGSEKEKENDISSSFSPFCLHFLFLGHFLDLTARKIVSSFSELRVSPKIKKISENESFYFLSSENEKMSLYHSRSSN
jgi:hypothetical protein